MTHTSLRSYITVTDLKNQNFFCLFRQQLYLRMWKKRDTVWSWHR